MVGAGAIGGIQTVSSAVERRAVHGHLMAVVSVVRIMGAVAIVGMLGILALAYEGKPIPDLLAGIISGALTGLPSLLARTDSAPPGRKEAQSGEGP